MANSFDIVGYTYKADIYCGECVLDELARDINAGYVEAAREMGFSTEKVLNRLALRIPLDREREETFDSGDFPKVIFRDQTDVADDEQCSMCGNYLVWNDG